MCYNALRKEVLKMGYIWLALAIVFGILEAATVQIVSIWFAGGSVAALIAYLFGASNNLQIAIFVIVSAILLLCTRPFVKKFSKSRNVPTNADAMIGKTAVVTKETDDLGLMGEAKVSGSVWTICSEDGSQIMKDEKVTVEKIEGVKLIVRK